MMSPCPLPIPSIPNAPKLGGNSLVVQWLRLRLPMQGVRVQSLIRELRSHTLLGQETKI